ncbi:hypothetical protein BDR04DRAFT_1037683, partial [Suillus decipiens]
SDDWKKERGWIIRFLSDGMMSTEDWKVLKHRHTWELLSSLVGFASRHYRGHIIANDDDLSTFHEDT